MHKTGNLLVSSACAVTLGLALTASSVVHAETKLCCYNNWRYSGTCVVQIGGNQVCGDVLGVLNNPMSAATTYCGGTQLRGGWATVECGTGGTAGSSGGTLSQPDYVTPTQPSYTAPSSKTRSVSPDQTTQPRTGIESQSPSFVTPVDPQTAPAATGPSVITL
jgi:hypothetical protein